MDAALYIYMVMGDTDEQEIYFCMNINFSTRFYTII